MSTFKVSTTAQLVSALKLAKAGDTVSLASGTYAGVTLKGLSYSGAVTIASADPTKPAVFSDLMVRYSSNLQFADVVLSSQSGGPTNAFQVLDSSKIGFARILAEGPPLGAAAEATGLMIRNSQQVAVTDSEFRNLKHGVSLLDNNGVTLTNNYFHDIRIDGIRGGGSSNVTIAENLFTDFRSADLDHADAVQFWTTNTTASASNIVVIGNAVVRGYGDPIQGIFFRDQVGNLPFKNVTISGNLVVGGSYNGIFADGVAGGGIVGNTVVALPDQASWIRTQASSGVLISGNIASAYNTVEGGVPGGNDLVRAADDGGAGALAYWLSGHSVPGGTVATAAELMSMLGYPSNLSSSLSASFDRSITMEGTAGADKLVADKLMATVINAGAGDDVLTGNGFSSKLVGGAGDDVYQVKGAGDVVVERAGEGIDTVSASVDYTLGANLEILRLIGDARSGTGNALDNRIVGGVGNDVLRGLGGNDQLQGGDGADTLYGDDGADMLRGDAGADSLLGGAGGDQLLGGSGNDYLDGGTGNDIVEGGVGNDIMRGGAGADTFRFRDESAAARDADRISDFARGVDLIDLRAIDAHAGTTANEAFTWIGASAFHGKAGELQVKAYGDGVRVSGDIDGDGVADFTIIVQGVTTLGAADFLL